MLLENANVKKIFDIFKKDNSESEVRLVGGCVRDSFLQEPIHDIDFATTYSPVHVADLFRSNGFKVLPTGLKHGTVTLLIGGGSYEITTLRRDICCDGRHATVEFTDNWHEDALRRDFTFNAMYLDCNNNLHDYFGGLKDLKEGRLRFVGDPAQRIAEDYLRILRAFRFYIRFCARPLDGCIVSAIRNSADKIDKLSGERVRSEMFKILADKNAFVGLEMMAVCGVWEYVWLSRFIGISLLRFVEQSDFAQDAALKLALVVLENNLQSRDLALRWKMSNQEKKLLFFLLDNVKRFSLEDLKEQYRFFIRKFGRENYICILKARAVIQASEMGLGPNFIAEFVKPFLDFTAGFILPDLPITGGDLLALGLHGKDVGSFLEYAWRQWEGSGYSLSKESLLDLLAVKKRQGF